MTHPLTFDPFSFDRGSLSEKKLLFSKGKRKLRDDHYTMFSLPVKPFHWPLLSSDPRTDCNNILRVSGLNASSFWDKNSQEHRMFWSSTNTGSGQDLQPWSAGGDDQNPWVELELSDRSSITGKNV